MSTDPTKRALPTPAANEEPPASSAPPTVAVPTWQSPAPPPPPPPPGPSPAPPASSAPPTAVDQQAMPTRWDRPQQAWQQPQWQQDPQETPTPPQGQWAPARPPGDGTPLPLPRKRKRRVRRRVMVLFTVIVLLILLVIGDRVALAITENDMASQFVSNGLPVKPSVTIEGFPFLTQLIGKDFNKVDISASNVPAGPVTIDTVHATINGMHISSLSSNGTATVNQLNATAFISFGALASAAGAGGGTGITVTPDGANKVKITAGLGGVFSDTEEAQITQTGAQTISVKVLPSNSPVGSLLSSFGSFSFSLPKGVPATLKITSLTLNSQGLNIAASATNATFGK